MPYSSLFWFLFSDLTVEKQLQWEVKIVPFNGMPFKIIGKKTYICHQGRDKHAKAKQRCQESKVRAPHRRLIIFGHTLNGSNDFYSVMSSVSATRS